MKRKLDHGDEAADGLAVEVLGWLAEDEDRLLSFLGASGLNPGTVRKSIRDPAFLAAVLDYVMGDEASLIACAEALGVRPEKIAAAWRRLQPPEFDHDL